MAFSGLIANPYLTSIIVKYEIKTSVGEIDFNSEIAALHPQQKSDRLILIHNYSKAIIASFRT